MNIINKIIQQLTIALNGAFIGAMILIALVLVPFWRTSESQVFLDWFTTYSGSIDSLMFPLGPGVMVLAILAFFLSKENRVLWVFTIILIFANILYYLIYFLPTNTSFKEQTIAINEVSGELTIWLRYHWQRIFFALGALITSIMAVFRK
ncbi:hypothetical protein [Aquimarina sp. 2201CG5-10]|uniref:hypothetical protein n=1 Tax=Aquimarina callyspongiae TaxID=3098150 RepID=UPI002AB5DC65|nr:hypothetical protein [Aquimarina sp. 2201CG5-10]MDY8135980.1 hypothetical protein [Aquimarina sp. 2201CG5-10]